MRHPYTGFGIASFISCAIVTCLSCAATASAGTAGAPPVAIEPELEASMRVQGSAAMIIDFAERPDLGAAADMDWEARGRFVVDQLRTAAHTSQARVSDYLRAEGIAFESFWIDNLILVPSAPQQVLDDLAWFPEIEILRADREIRAIEPVKRTPAPETGRNVEPNIAHISADQVWALGIDGTGSVVSGIDTGVRYTHDVLQNQYRGNLGSGSYIHDYNWMSGDGGASSPVDGHGHGTHTVGTMVGDDGGANQVGVAPGATWIACEGCPDGWCSTSSLLTCAQWIAAPYPVGDPASPDPTKRPHVVNNSWGDCDRSYDGWFQGVVDSWHAAGVYPIFSNVNAGNCGYAYPPGCNTVGNPARYGNVTGVGSTGQANGAYAAHSNWGPTDNPDSVNPSLFPAVKPQVVAPGVNIRSSVSSGNSSYASWDGTSMSAPHVAGLVALMWQAAPCLVGDYAQTESLIQTSATPIAYATGCGGEGPGNVPNMATGWGEINALEAVLQAAAYCGTDNWVVFLDDFEGGTTGSWSVTTP
jgi:subtilisin family serine protease